FFFQAEDGIRDFHVTGVQTCALPICPLGNCPDPGLPVFAEEFHVAVETRSPRSVPDPGPAGQHIPLETRTKIVDLVADNDPDIRSEERRVGKECRERRSREQRRYTAE